MKIVLKFFSNSFIIFLTYLVFNFYLRFFTFYYSTIDWDEITYFIIAKGILDGKIPYVELWDLKPVGSFLVYSLSILCFGYSIETIRMTVWIFNSLLAFGIFLHLRKENFFLAFLSGIFTLYLFILFPSGLSGNTELLFTSLEVWGLYFILEKNIYKNGLGFLLLGFAFIVKYIIVFDIVWFIIFYIFGKSPSLYRIFKEEVWYNFVFSLLGRVGMILILLIPFLIVALFYFFSEHFLEFWNVTFGVASRHKRTWNLIEMFDFLWKIGKIFIPINLLFMFILLLKVKRFHGITLYLIWIFTSVFGAIWTGFFYEHYLLACIPSLVLVTGKLSAMSWKIFRREKFFNKWKEIFKIFALILLVIISVQRKFQLKKIISKIGDEQKEIATLLRQLKVTNLFVGYGYHTTYVLLNKYPPTKYVQPNNYTEEIFAKNFELNLFEFFEDLSRKNIEVVQWCGEISPFEITKEYAQSKGIYFEYVLKMRDFLNEFQTSGYISSCKIYKKK